MGIVRLILGLLQMAGAVFSWVLIWKTGIGKASVAAVVGTCLLTTVSVLLFGSRDSSRQSRRTR
jgi:hypothetical protein